MNEACMLHYTLMLNKIHTIVLEMKLGTDMKTQSLHYGLILWTCARIHNAAQCMVWLSTVTMVQAELSESCSLIFWHRQAFLSSKLHVFQLCGPFPIQQVPGVLCRGQSRWVLKLTTHFHLVSILMVWSVNSLCTGMNFPSVQHNYGIISHPLRRN